MSTRHDDVAPGSAGASVRVLAADLLDQYEAAPSALSGALDRAQRRLDPRDRRLLQQLVLGTLRWRGRIDHVIAAAADRPLGRIDARLLSPLRLGAFQLLFLDRVPGYAAVSEAVDEARRRSRRAASFANAVLRRISRSPTLEEWPVEAADPIERLAVVTSHPAFLVRRWLDAFGAEATESLLEANNRQAPLQLLSFRDLGGRDHLAAELAREGVATRPLELAPQGLEVTSGDPFGGESYRAGLFYVQDQASQAAALVPAPTAGERVLDAAAAPGGKSFSLLAAEPQARVVAADISGARVALLRENRERLGRRLPLLVADAARPALGPRFDRVVVDLPCAGTGILARHPDLKWRLSMAEIGRLAAQGLDLLAGAAEMVRPGGLLVAVTCSIEREENERVGEGFLARDARFARARLNELLSPPLDRAIAGPGLWRWLPGPGNDGFTVQVWERRAVATA